MALHIILGAGGIIADNLAKELTGRKEKIRLVSRNPKPMAGAETFQADLTVWEQTNPAIEQGSVVYLCVGLKYDYKVWRAQWPPIMDHVMRACSEKQAKLIFFDNVYMYGRVIGPMTEESPYDPCSRKGDLRARLATRLMSEVRKGNITATIARAADFYGPGADKTSVPNMLVFSNLAQQKKAQWLLNTEVKHSFTYTPDTARALYLLATKPDSWNQVWHLPTAANPLTGKEFIEAAAAAMGNNPGYRVLNKWMIRLGGIFDKTIRELNEMTYQNEFEYIFDSSKFNREFNFQPTGYLEGIQVTASSFLRKNPV
jgi:nucleoside-diphosphate-sugar epimerase